MVDKTTLEGKALLSVKEMCLFKHRSDQMQRIAKQSCQWIYSPYWQSLIRTQEALGQMVRESNLLERIF